MSSASQISKYLTIDQVLTFSAVYEAVILGDGRIADAVAALSQSDDRRDQSSVMKVIAALNRKFEAPPIGLPLLVKDEQSDSWRSTAVGDSFYLFASELRTRFSTFDKELSKYKQAQKPISIYVRKSAAATLFKLQKAATDDGLQQSAGIQQFDSSNFRNAFSIGADIVIDEMFLSDKKTIAYHEYHYFQLEQEDIILVTSNGLLADEVNSTTGSIDANQLKDLPIIVPSKPFSIRVAASVAAISLREDCDYLATENLDLLRGCYTKFSLGDADIGNLALLLAGRSAGYALLLSRIDAQKLDETVGIAHDKHTVLQRNNPLYYNLTAIFRRSDKNNPPNAEFRHWIAAAYKLSAREIKLDNKRQDYSASGFLCAHCQNRITYDPAAVEPGGQYFVCPSCIYVNEFDINTGAVRQHKSVSQIDYYSKAEIEANVFQCKTVGCGNAFAPFIAQTNKGNEYIFCDDCGTVYQPEETKTENVTRRCPLCNRDHNFRISVKKTIDKISCYESLRHIEYDSIKDEVKAGLPLEIESIVLDKVELYNTFECPHFGCPAITSRRLFRNSRREGFSRCANCGKDIRIYERSPKD